LLAREVVVGEVADIGESGDVHENDEDDDSSAGDRE
jgi:hypothetical protein